MIHLLVALHVNECIQLNHQHVFAAYDWHHHIINPCWLTSDQTLVLMSYIGIAASRWFSMHKQVTCIHSISPF